MVSKSQVPSMAWMPAWHHFLEVRLENRLLVSWAEQKVGPNSLDKPPNFILFLHRIIENFNNNLSFVKGFLRFKSRHFASMRGTWDPMRIGPNLQVTTFGRHPCIPSTYFPSLVLNAQARYGHVRIGKAHHLGETTYM